MSGSLREWERWRGRKVRAETTTSLLPGGGAGVLVERGGGPVKRTLSTRAMSLRRWDQRSSFNWRESRASTWPRLSSREPRRGERSLVWAGHVGVRNKSKKPLMDTNGHE